MVLKVAPFLLDADLSHVEGAFAKPSDRIIVDPTIRVIHQVLQVIQGLKLAVIHI
jgi:hypothetical protein